MIRHTLLPILLLPSIAFAGDWENPTYWAERLVRNDTKVIQCYQLLNEQNVKDFRRSCSPHVMARTNNVLEAEYDAVRALHTDLDDVEFLRLYFTPNQVDVKQLAEEYAMRPSVRSAIVSFYIVEGLTHNPRKD